MVDSGKEGKMADSQEGGSWLTVGRGEDGSQWEGEQEMVQSD